MVIGVTGKSCSQLAYDSNIRPRINIASSIPMSELCQTCIILTELRNTLSHQRERNEILAKGLVLVKLPPWNQSCETVVEKETKIYRAVSGDSCMQDVTECPLNRAVRKTTYGGGS